MKVEVDGFSRLVTFIKQMQDEIIWTQPGRIMEWKISWVNQQACQVILCCEDGGFFFNLLKRHILFSQEWSYKDSLPRNASGYTPSTPSRRELLMGLRGWGIYEGTFCTRYECMCTVAFSVKIIAWGAEQTKIRNVRNEINETCQVCTLFILLDSQNSPSVGNSLACSPGC